MNWIGLVSYQLGYDGMWQDGIGLEKEGVSREEEEPQSGLRMLLWILNFSLYQIGRGGM